MSGPGATAVPAQARLCSAAGCRACGSEAIRSHLETSLAERGLAGRLRLRRVGCLGPCGAGPLLALDPGGARQGSVIFGGVTRADADSLVEALAAVRLDSWEPQAAQRFDQLHPFFRLQRRIVLENCGRIDPESIDEAIAAGAYVQLKRAVASSSPEAVIERIRRSGLRGRGGAGYPTGLKWQSVAGRPGPEKVVVCNADEGDPGAFMDRTVLEGDPHRVLEGMAIAAYAVGARLGFIYIRAEYELAIAHLRRAIEQASGRDLLGDVAIELRVGAGAYVCGEETALLHSIEGGRGTPRPRPPYPAEHGLWGRPTLINNVETFANVVPILREGADWFAAIGTPTSAGTKVFSLTGHVRLAGVLEVPMGTPLATVVEQMGGGAPGGVPIKAVQTGGPSGGCVPAKHLDTPVDYESLKELGTIMGSGGMVVLDATTDMVDLAAFFMGFCREESCGKCVPCRAGTVQLHDLLRKHLERRATAADLEQLESLCHMVADTSLCGLGQSAPRPVLSALRHFRGDFLALLQPKASAVP
ncbi:NuoF family protein [Cyanobium sp. Morenito 9A2]|uniref:NuoF family protein n=1 Tax=Cyanobium sp. Morenito 9A2 TaxID=2823718 RepID=UPI0020CEDA1B|nr:NADH-ubiquinone oxidoreductase-F iron-sulfur binding region domain-containing protein [Cyanobium sp. Morenito 9A2]MCP9848826.1 SLBB domain-containing protein [Cyanobium sp. Morenito 9A2]